MQIQNLNYLLLFCRIVVGLIFISSTIGKIKDLDAFRQTIIAFKILPRQFVNMSALLFILSEIIIFLTMLFGGSLLITGFIFAFILLSVFCLALILALSRGVATSCNCFGENSKNNISIYDVWRNLLIIFLCLSGGTLATMANINGAIRIGFLDLLLISPIAIVTSAVIINFSNIFHIFSNISKES